MVRRGEEGVLLVTVGQWSFVAQLDALTAERRWQTHRCSIGLGNYTEGEQIPRKKQEKRIYFKRTAAKDVRET